MKTYEGALTGQDISVGIIVSRFNTTVTERLLAGALDCLRRHGVKDKNIQLTWVPGAFEIPLAAQQMCQKSVHAVVCLGAVIRGSTPHFDFVCNQVSKGVGSVSLKESLPVIFGVLTTDTIEQAIERSGTKAGNKGWDSALAAIEMANLMVQLKEN